MIKKQFFVFFVFLAIINYNYGFTVVSQDTKITADKFDSYEISDRLIINDINSNKLELPIVPSYDVIVKINNQKYSNFAHTFDLLTINLDFIPNTLNLEIIYLTDYYTTKNNGIWNLKYVSKYIEMINTLIITLPKNAEIKETVQPYSTLASNKQLVLFFKDVKEINISYDLKNIESKNNYYLLLIPFLFIIGYLFYKIKPIKKIKRKKDLCLGLNENEQKIMKVIMENEGQSQKVITAKCFLPKGTVSRNIKKLVNKGYIDIKKYGVCNKLFLGEVFKKGDKNE